MRGTLRGLRSFGICGSSPSSRPSPRERGEGVLARGFWTSFLALHRDPHGRAKAAHRAVAEHDVAAMGARDVAGDRKAQARAAFILVAGAVEPEERLEHFLAHGQRNARSVIVDRDRQITVIAMAGDR